MKPQLGYKLLKKEGPTRHSYCSRTCGNIYLAQPRLTRWFKIGRNSMEWSLRSELPPPWCAFRSAQPPATHLNAAPEWQWFRMWSLELRCTQVTRGVGTIVVQSNWDSPGWFMVTINHRPLTRISQHGSIKEFHMCGSWGLTDFVVGMMALWHLQLTRMKLSWLWLKWEPFFSSEGGFWPGALPFRFSMQIIEHFWQMVWKQSWRYPGWDRPIEVKVACASFWSWKKVRDKNGLLRYILYTCPNLW